MLETTNSINIFAPMMFCSFTATKVADAITPSFYKIATDMKHIQILPVRPPTDTRTLEARNFMN